MDLWVTSFSPKYIEYRHWQKLTKIDDLHYHINVMNTLKKLTYNISRHRQLAAIMFTDIVGYTSLMGKNEAKAMEQVHQSHEIQKRLVEEFEGNWVKEMGDGVMCSFSSATDAIYCALEIQEQLFLQKDLNLRIGIHLGEVLVEDGDIFSDGVNIAFRLQSIAEPGGIYLSESVQKAIRGQTDIHTVYLGELQLKNVDYQVKTYALSGEGLPPVMNGLVKRLSRRVWIETKRKILHRTGLVYLSLACILLSLIPWIPLLKHIQYFLTSSLLFGFMVSMVLAWFFEKSPNGFIRISSHKSLENPYSNIQKKPFTNNAIVLALMVLLLGINAFTIVENNHIAPLHGQVVKSIAVLPFCNLSNDSEQIYFADGIQEDILTLLSKNSQLDVRSRTSTLLYRNKEDKNMEEIGMELSVAHVLAGSVRRIGNIVRVSVQLIEVDTDSHIWSEVYDRELTDILAIQQELAASISNVISVRLTK